MAVGKALCYLMKEYALYQEANIQIDTTCMNTISDITNENREFIFGQTNASEEHPDMVTYDPGESKNQNSDVETVTFSE